MNTEVFLNFLNNILLLMSLSVIYYVFRNDSFLTHRLRKFLMGIFVSVIVAIVMINSYVLAEVNDGIMFDTRAVILSISGMFFGFIPTLMGVITASTVRILQGGVGTFTGVSWIIVSASIGLLWRRFRLKNPNIEMNKINWIELYIVSLFIQVVMILLFFTMPSEFIYPIINAVAFPMLVVYPIGSLFVAQFLIIIRRQYFKDVKTQESEKQYRELFTKNKTNLMLVNPSDGSIVDANSACEGTYGYSLDDLKSMNLKDIHTLSYNEFKDVKEEVFEHGQYSLTTKHIDKNGEQFDVEEHISTIVLDDIQYIYINVIDISEQVQSEKMFKDADERLRSTLLSVGEGVVVTDEYARITIVNSKAMELLNKTQPINRKKVFNEFRIYSNQNNQTFEEIYHECIKENKMFRGDNTYCLLTSNDDKEIFVDFTISPIISDNGVNHGAIIVIRDVTIEKARQEEIRFMSRHDYLTGLYNRFNFEVELERLDVSRQLPISLLIGDINGLKLVNDAFGHLEGDKLIKEAASIFKKATRQEDIVARWGGDEFAILLPQTSTEGAISVQKRINDLCKKSMYDVITPSISIGYATKTDESQDIRSVLGSAEEMMYSNKLIEGPEMRTELLNHIHNKLNENVLNNESHSNNLISMVSEFCEYYKYPKEDRELCVMYARYHDIGRIGVEHQILNKPGTLTEDEFDKVKTHAEIGSRLVATIPELQHLSQPILHHHERYDGKGYPLGLKGKDINDKARMFSIFDAYDAMTNDRTYKDKMTKEEAINEILRCTGTQFDPEKVQLFLEFINKKDD